MSGSGGVENAVAKRELDLRIEMWVQHKFGNWELSS